MVRRRQEARNHFDQWSQSYEKGLAWRYFFSPIHRQLFEAVGAVGRFVVLDIGCGTGALLRRFAAAGAARLVGIDVSEGMLEVARASTAEDARFEFQRAVAENLPFGDGQFDVVSSCLAFHHFPDPQGALREMGRVMRPGGRLLLCDMCGEGYLSTVILAIGRRLSTDEHYFTRSQLVGLAAEVGFRVEKALLIRQLPQVMLLTCELSSRDPQ